MTSRMVSVSAVGKNTERGKLSALTLPKRPLSSASGITADGSLRALNACVTRPFTPPQRPWRHRRGWSARDTSHAARQARPSSRTACDRPGSCRGCRGRSDRRVVRPRCPECRDAAGPRSRPLRCRFAEYWPFRGDAMQMLAGGAFESLLKLRRIESPITGRMLSVSSRGH